MNKKIASLRSYFLLHSILFVMDPKHHPNRRKPVGVVFYIP